MVEPFSRGKTSRFYFVASLVAGPGIFFILTAAGPPADIPRSAWVLIALLGWMVAWWVSEAVPLAATALLPVVVMPLTGIADIGTVTRAYGHPLIFLFLGGFMLALAIEAVGLHRRVALAIISRVGTRPKTLTLGFMIATAFLSMWVTNTAATILMYAVALSVIEFIRDRTAPDERQDVRRFTVSLLLAIAYSASIGGMATLIGSPVNALLATILSGEYGITVEFVDWFLIGLPVSMVMLVIAWVLLTKLYFGNLTFGETELGDMIRTEIDGLPTVSFAEVVVASTFLLVAVGWMFGDPISRATGLPITDTTVALTAALLLFAIPVNRSLSVSALDWPTAVKLPWHVLLLIGGGLAVALAFQVTGLADWIGSRVAGFNIGVLAMILIITIMMVFLTEIMSNPA